LANNSSITAEWAARFSTLLSDELADTPTEAAEGAELLTPAQMEAADKWTIEAGTPGIILMERAGAAVATIVRRRVSPGSEVVVLAGPGNNGGDGFVAASNLADAGYMVTVVLVGDRTKLSGDAQIAANNWLGPIVAPGLDVFEHAHLIVDALFGAGLDRPIEGSAAEVIAAANDSGLPILAVDLPSGIDGRNGAILGAAINAEQTVTFFRRKPGHVLMPGRIHCGRILVVDIGIDVAALETIAPTAFHNVPQLWRAHLPKPHVDGHKYDRGHAIVVSGPMTRTGAARLAARGALRVGAGLVTVASPRDALQIHASQLTAIMILPMDGSIDLVDILADERRNAVLLGPALGVGAATQALVEAALGMAPVVVLDADALTSFADEPKRLFELISGRTAPTVLTPHDGEFARVFPDLLELPSKLDRAREAARRSGAIIVLKGPDTTVSAPDGRAAVADNAPPDLATAGSGDVLAGMVCGQLAQRMPAFEAAASAVWLHGAAARKVGRGLISDDLPEALLAVFADLFPLGAGT
jgi:ADP-dependent NAD(P)H-hydrate dehydratase / NAD(P)H-hydrate epimerase